MLWELSVVEQRYTAVQKLPTHVDSAVLSSRIAVQPPVPFRIRVAFPPDGGDV